MLQVFNYQDIFGVVSRHGTKQTDIYNMNLSTVIREVKRYPKIEHYFANSLFEILLSNSLIALGSEEPFF